LSVSLLAFVLLIPAPAWIEALQTWGDRTMAKAKSAKSKRPAAKRELIDTGTDKRYVRRDDQGRFNESDDVGRSLSQDRKRKAKTVAKAGQGDKGDRAPAKSRSRAKATSRK
jgi:hypothetical protein